MNRDWQKDMERVERFKYAQTLCNGIQPTFHGMISMPEPDVLVIEYWLQQAKFWKEQYDSATDDAEETQQQLEAEKERADKANEGYRLLRKLYDKQCSEKMEYYNEMVIEKERADKLKEALEAAQVHLSKEHYMSAETAIEEALASLYPKE